MSFAGTAPTTVSARGSFTEQDTEALLVLALDTSGSFLSQIETGNAGKLMVHAIDQYRRANIGSSDAQLIIATLDETADDPLVYEGSIAQLSNRFPKPEALTNFIVRNAKSNGSHILEGLARTTSYVNRHSALKNNPSCQVASIF